MLEGWVDEEKGNDGHDHEEEHLSHGEDHKEHDVEDNHGNIGKGNNLVV